METEAAPKIEVIPPGKWCALGDRGAPRTKPMRQRVPLHGFSRPNYVQDGYVLPPDALFTVPEWAPIPIHLFKKNKDPEFRAQIHHSGTKVRTWRAKRAVPGWKESKGSFQFKDAAGNPVGRRSFKLKRKRFLASVLVAQAFWTDLHSETRNLALHIVRIEERSEQSDDSVRNVRWGTDKENKEDKTADGQASNREGQKIAVYGKPVTKDKISLGLPPGVDYDPRFKDGTYARFDSAADAARLITAHINEYNRTAKKALMGITKGSISEALSGNLDSAGGWQWGYDSVPEPAASDIRFLDKSQKGERYMTRDGRLLYKKRTSQTTHVYVQTTQTARPSGYLKLHLNAHAPDELGENSQFHRIVSFLFNRAQLDEKIASSGLRMEDLDVDHDDENKFNNAASNLVWRTRAEHNTKTRGLHIIEKTADGTHVCTFPSIAAAAASANMNQHTFWSRLKAGGGSATITSNGTTRYFFRSVPDEAVVEDVDDEDDSSEDDSSEDDSSEDDSSEDDEDKMA
jgi:hypothetical protein